MALQADLPPGVLFYITDNQRHYYIPVAPFRLKVEMAAAPDLLHIFLGPAKICFILYDNLQFIGLQTYLLQGRAVLFRRKTDPVRVSAKRLRSGSFNEYPYSKIAQTPDDIVKVIIERFSPLSLIHI